MDSYDQTTQFRYNPNANAEGNTEFSGILEIYVHHARNIHNICIYDNQDVYAKFSLTCNPDETFATRIINGGGKNPEFNEKLVIKVLQSDAVLKCEMWMLSRAKNYMEDQLLGFSLVPVSLVFGKGKVTQDFSLSSTDLFHSPAGTVKLSLSLNTHLPFDSSLGSATSSSITSEVVLLDRKISEVALEPGEYSRIEFPDVNVVRENQQMVSEYLGLARQSSALRVGILGPGSFLRLGCPDHPLDDYEMVANSSEDNRGVSISPNESVQNSGFLSSTMTSLSDDRNSYDSLEKKNHLLGDSSGSSNAAMTAETNPETPTSKNGSAARDEKELKEESAMQQQIVDMYLRSMQQFTESLGKMKLPINLENTKPETEDHRDTIQQRKKNLEMEIKKKDGSRVFYGSRAFF